MRIVYVLPFFSFPPRDGLSIRVWQTLTFLSRHHELHIVLPVRALTDELEVALQPLVASITPVPTHPNRLKPRAATRRETFKDALTYPPSLFRRAEQDAVTPLVVNLLERGADWLICETQLTGQIALTPGFPRVRRCLSLHDLYDQYARRKHGATPWGPYKLKLALDAWKIRRYETSVMRQFDLITVVSDDEEPQARARARGSEVLLVPNGVDTDYFRPDATLAPAKTSSAPTLLFVGNLSYEPNQDAVRFFLANILPLIRNPYPDVRVIILGKDPPPWLRSSSDTGVTVTGTVHDVRPYYAAADAVVAPIRLGGGTKIKVLEALAMAAPLITTTAGTAGIAAETEHHVLVGTSASHFAEQVCRVLDDHELARRLSSAGRSLVVEHYTWHRILPGLEDALERGAPRHGSVPARSLTPTQG